MHRASEILLDALGLRTSDSARNPWHKLAWMVFALLIAAAIGQFSAVIGAVLVEKPTILLALPLVMILGLVFILNRPFLLLVILITRPGLDPILEFTKLPVGEAGLGLGAILNGLILLLTISMLFERGDYRLKNARMFVPILLIVLVGVFRSPLPADAIKLYLSMITAFAAFIIGDYMADSKDGAYGVMRLVVWSSIIPTFTGWIMFASGFSFSTSQSFDSMDGAEGNRFSGPFSHPNIMAFYCLLVIVALLYLWRTNQLSTRPWVKFIAPVHLMSLLGLMAWTKTRSAWAACAATFLLYGLIFERKFIIYFVIGLIASLSLPSVQERIVDIFSGTEYKQYAKLNSYAWRTLLWTEALGWMPDSGYVFGLGFESFRFNTPNFFTLSNRAMIGAHNVYLEIFFELGAVGLLAFTSIFVVTANKLLPTLRSNKMLGGFGFLLLIVYALVCYSDNMIAYLVVNLYFWLMLGAITGHQSTLKVERR
jgi:putative inorganic carbon (HCO3(-)) transporter